jgi:hypothetical protein
LLVRVAQFDPNQNEAHAQNGNEIAAVQLMEILRRY